jgi:hypothetical protein
MRLGSSAATAVTIPTGIIAEVSPELRRVRGSYLIADGIASSVKHVGLYHQSARAVSMAR